MFSLIYHRDNEYGVLDNKTLKYHKLNKDSFDVMVYSAIEEGVNLDGVTIESDSTYSCNPVAFTKDLNIYNTLPYIKGISIPVGFTNEKLYNMYLDALLGMSLDSSTPSSLIIESLGLFAYISLIVESHSKVDQGVLNALVSSLAVKNPEVLKVLTTEPFKNDVMRKFDFKPEFCSA